MAAHGLHYSLLELEFTDRQKKPTMRRLLSDNGDIRANDRDMKSFSEFVVQNQDYLAALDELLSAHASVFPF